MNQLFCHLWNWSDWPHLGQRLVISLFRTNCAQYKDFPHSSVGKESACNAGDLSSVPEWGRSSGEGNGNPLQYSLLENPMDRGSWQATIHGITRVRHDLVTKPPPPCSIYPILWNVCWFGLLLILFKTISQGNYADVLFFFSSKIYLFFGCTGSSLLLGLSLVAVGGLLLLLSIGSRWAGSVVVTHRLKLLCGMWDLPGPGIKPMSPALQGRFF